MERSKKIILLFKIIFLVIILSIFNILFLVGDKKDYPLIPQKINDFNYIKKINRDETDDYYDYVAILNLYQLNENVEQINFYLVNILIDVNDNSYPKHLILELKYFDGEKYSFKVTTHKKLKIDNLEYRQMVIATNHKIQDVFVLDRFGNKIPIKKQNTKYFENFLKKLQKKEKNNE